MHTGRQTDGTPKPLLRSRNRGEVYKPVSISGYAYISQNQNSSSYTLVYNKVKGGRVHKSSLLLPSH